MNKKWYINILIFLAHISTLSSVRVCEPGTFGWHCKFSCYCAEGSCDPVTGACPSGCKQNRYGPGCQLLSVFRYSVDAHGYQGNTDRTVDGEECVPWNNTVFIAMYGLKSSDFPDKAIPGAVCRNPLNPKMNGLEGKGPWCFTNFIEKSKYFGSCDIPLRGCDSGRFGEMCEFECHCKDEDSCTRLGTCPSGCHPGWLNTTCQTSCKSGYYGDGCLSTCGNCKSGLCDFESGECDGGCSTGWKGKLCKTGCADGEYGENCLGVCGACRRPPCDVHTGQCEGGCQDGYRGILCKTECEAGYFGTNCSRTCGHCMTGSCHFETGVCSSGCKPGWQGIQCLEACDDFTFGENCSTKCGACHGMTPCEKETGLCTGGCEEGFVGDQCMDLVPRELSDNTSLGSAIGGVIAGLVIIAIIVVVVLFIRRRKLQQLTFDKKGQDEERRPVELTQSKETDQLIANESSMSDHLDDTDPNLNEPIYANVNTKKQSSPIKVADLFDYIRENKKNECEGFKKEFNELPHGLMALCDEAKKSENKPKNRYGNITAYDHSRVVLDPLPNDPNSDYINANFIDGYNRKGAYIASQGPTKVMIRDFWRMIWQKRVCKIVMLTNLMEACKKKCEQYWSEEGAAKYGDITVEMLDTAVFNDFAIRTFKIAANGASRIVKQFHFTSWSDHGALIYPTPLLTFRRKVRMYSPDSTAPIVVHCSAGIGRSGTYIALDYLLDQAKNENIVDVLKCAQLMRANRINMIQTWEQYVFVYETILEATMAGETTIAHSAFRAQYEELCLQPDNGGPTKMEEQFKVLQKLTTGIDSSQFKEALDPDNVSKNRVKNILPAKRCRPNLYTQVEGCNNYINAMFLPGYLHRDSFIVTQMPLPNTVADFWRMLYDYNSHTVVMLNEFDRNDKSCALYWPEEYGYTVEYDPLSIELLSSTEDNNVSIRIFKLSNRIKKEERAIKQFQLKSWTETQIVPNNPDSMMQIIEMVYDWMKQNGKGPITVHCMNGAKKSGLFCAINLMFERMQRDHEVDVFQTLKTIRVNRPQFIEDIEQYQFCYQMALKYLDYNDL
ncbi:receptor-type tyrosine-protein phosphatase kappa-like [Saccostrea echinata]|uniref:receptor-type tyrosine-protein phosphatase kappa-like n=1 Tax=Saccostrea echinata TaxID=191078 RepID=UPI002A82F85D|nr:receptor-type tyrosine-protein phosphatase kappa-like [Saccostrea echinata]